MDDPSPVRETHLLLRLARIVDLFRDLLRKRCAMLGLAENRAAVLQILQAAGSQGCSQTELAAEVGLSESNVSGLITRMRAEGLLSQLRSKQDRRRCILLLTQRGANIARAAMTCQAEILAEITTRLQHHQTEDLCQIITEWEATLAAVEPGRTVNQSISTREAA